MRKERNILRLPLLGCFPQGSRRAIHQKGFTSHGDTFRTAVPFPFLPSCRKPCVHSDYIRRNSPWLQQPLISSENKSLHGPFTPLTHCLHFCFATKDAPEQEKCFAMHKMGTDGCSGAKKHISAASDEKARTRTSLAYRMKPDILEKKRLLS